MPSRTTNHYPIYLLISALLIGGSWLFPVNKAGSETLSDQAGVRELPALALAQPLPITIDTKLFAAIRVRSAILMDGRTASVLYAKEPHRSVPVASTTKLMTALVVQDLLDLDTVIEVTASDTAIIGSDIQLRPGEKITARHLLAGLLIASGNDAALALARFSAGSIESFVDRMNQKAAGYGLRDTRFADPAGLDDTGYSSAFDLAILARAALADPVIAEFVRMPQLTITSLDGRIRHELQNSNRLVGEFAYPGAIGLKTGFTPEAGHCLVAAAERNGHLLISVVLHTDEDTITASAHEARKLLDWGWQTTNWN